MIHNVKLRIKTILRGLAYRMSNTAAGLAHFMEPTLILIVSFVACAASVAFLFYLVGDCFFKHGERTRCAPCCSVDLFCVLLAWFQFAYQFHLYLYELLQDPRKEQQTRTKRKVLYIQYHVGPATKHI